MRETIGFEDEEDWLTLAVSRRCVDPAPLSPGRDDCAETGVNVVASPLRRPNEQNFVQKILAPD